MHLIINILFITTDKKKKKKRNKENSFFFEDVNLKTIIFPFQKEKHRERTSL